MCVCGVVRCHCSPFHDRNSSNRNPPTRPHSRAVFHSSPTPAPQAMSFAQDYIKKFERPAFLPITRIMQGAETDYFWNFFN